MPGQWGWPKIRPLVTTSFEVGADWNFITDYTAGLTAYYKQQVQPAQRWQLPSSVSGVAAQPLGGGIGADEQPGHARL